MEFLILGPLEASDGGRKLPLGGAKQRALLALLLLHANEVVSSDRLIDELWGEAGSRDAAKSLSVAVSRLRKTLAPGRPAGEQDGLLVTRAPGYELRLAPGQLDLKRFEQLVAEARTATDPATAAETLRDALALWRGQPLADLAYEPFAHAHIARLEELRLATLEERLRADLELGRHAELVGELESLVAEHPLREHFHGQLMLALYRSGRQAEALEAYQAARTALTGELGIEPSRELRELQEAILRQEIALDLRPPAAAADAPSRGVFVGRELELAELVAGLDDAFGGRGRLLLLAGEPGIGKSRLADELAAQARARGGRVLFGRCWEAGGAPSFWPWTQALRAYAREASPRRCEPSSARAPRISPRSCRSCASAFLICRHRLRSIRRGRASASSRRRPSSCAEPPSRGRSCSSSTTSTRPTLPRCSCFASSRESSARPASWCSARTGRPTRSRGRPSPR
jgi:DNA-binding SARP family transcriptional activator